MKNDMVMNGARGAKRCFFMKQKNDIIMKDNTKIVPKFSNPVKDAKATNNFTSPPPNA